MTIISRGFLLAPNVPRVARTIDLTLDGSPTTGTLTIWQHDNARLFFTASDAAGDPVTIVGVSDITLRIARRAIAPALLTKSLTGGGLNLGAKNVFWTDLSAADTGAMPPGHLYCETRITTAGSRFQTVFAGTLVVSDTAIGD